MSKKIFLIGEGVTEKCFLKALSISGRFQEANLYQERINKYWRLFNDYSTIYIFYDTDLLKKTTESTLFLENLQKLKTQKIKFHLLQQEENLEDVIINACSLSEKKLLKTMNISSISELKDKITKNSTSFLNLVEKSPINLARDKLWEHKNLNQSMKIYKNSHCDYKALKKDP